MNHGSDDVHELSIPWTSPFRITEEGLGWTYIGNYFVNETPAQQKEKKCSTYKIWNTSVSGIFDRLGKSVLMESMSWSL